MTQFYNQRQTPSTHKGLFHPVGAGRASRGEGGTPQGLVFFEGRDSVGSLSRAH